MREHGVSCDRLTADVVLRAALRPAWRLSIIRPVNAPLVSAYNADYRKYGLPSTLWRVADLTRGASQTEAPRRISHFRRFSAVFPGFFV